MLINKKGRFDYLLQYLKYMEQTAFSDQKLEALIHRMDLKEPDLFCQAGKRIRRACTNTQCRISLMCGDQGCQSCGLRVHPRCFSVSFNGITNLLNQRVGLLKHLIIKTSEIDEQLASAIRDSKKEFAQDCWQSFQPNYRRVVEQLYDKKNARSLSGKQAKNIYEQLQLLNKTTQQKSRDLIMNYRNTINQFTKGFKAKKNKILSQLFESSSLIEYSLDSKILKMSQDQVDFLYSSLGNPSELKLLFRASEHDFSAQAFHRRCDGIQDTVTVVRTEFGKTIAAYTHYEWSSENSSEQFGKFIDDAEKRTFILSLDLKEKMVPLTGNNLIYCSKSVGPTFGQGDLEICHECNVRRKSIASFPSRYNHQGAYKYQKGQTSFQALSGATQGDNFLVLEYEVFLVIHGEAQPCHCNIY